MSSQIDTANTEVIDIKRQSLEVIPTVPKLGPEPVLLSRKEVDVLYEILDAVKNALESLLSVKVNYIVTGGSLLGAIRQHSILFCDDDIDIAIILEDDDNQENPNKNNVYEQVVVPELQQALGPDYIYQIRQWEGGDRVRSKRMNNVFLDLFVLRKYHTLDDFVQVIGIKKNGQLQQQSYVDNIIQKIQTALLRESIMKPTTIDKSSIFPFWHFSTRKAIEMWTKEVYKDYELFPLERNLKMGPLTAITGPHMPVRLLKRAFGDDCFDVYYQSASHKTKEKPTAKTTNHRSKESTVMNGCVTDTTDLPPLVAAGGTWEGGQKLPLEEEHYLPMQPIVRSKRRPTLHCKHILFEYLERQNSLEEEELEKLVSSKDPSSLSRSRPGRTVYMDGVFDLFHMGHLKAIRQCASLGNRVVIGVTGDDDATGYKRRPIVPERERVAIVAALSDVNQVICPCPLIVTKGFMDEHGIDLVVHGFANDADAQRQYEFFEIPMKLGKFQRISYYQGLSTTDRIRNIHDTFTNLHEKNGKLKNQENVFEMTNVVGKPQWFGATLAAATNNSSTIPMDPFPLYLRNIIEPHIKKARVRRQESLLAIRKATGGKLFDSTMNTFRQLLSVETDFRIDDEDKIELLSSLLQSTNFPADTNLSKLHLQQDERPKDRMLHALTQNPTPFHEVFDSFARRICVPRLASILEARTTKSCNAIYYQSFPCLRIVQPNEFSIGPHADVCYGHHPCSVNFYIPFTDIGGSSSLFLESRPGAEDWHSMEGGFGDAKHFAGAICMHWTTENKTPSTRVSLDFRAIDADMYESLHCGGDHPGGQIDVYRKLSGYYSKCEKHVSDDGTIEWKRMNLLTPPDYRIGFPWTVKDWDKFWNR